MPKTARPSRQNQNLSFEKENKSPNIGELKPAKRKIVVRTLSRREEEARRGVSENSDNRSRSCSSNPREPNDESIDQHHGPLSGRDPLRDPLQSRLPFTTVAWQKGSKKIEKKPAYAFKSVTSHLLEISENPPEPHDIEMGSDDGRPAKFYPIALNDGAVGLHTGANFGKDGFNAMSHNTHRSNWNAVNPVVSFPWNEGEGTFSNEKAKLKEARTDQTRTTNHPDLNVTDGDDEETTDSDSPFATMKLHPWKEWERLNKRMTPLPVFGGGRGLPQLPKQHKTKSSRKSGIYNQDDFDYAIVLRPMKEYEECASVLDIASELSRSIFDRAINDVSTPLNNRKLKKSGSMKISLQKARKRVSSTGKYSPYRKSPIKQTPPSLRGRRWNRKELRSAPVTSVRKKSPKRSTYTWQNTSHEKKSKRQNGQAKKGNPNVLDPASIPNPKVPRGMARKQGLEEFLWALEQGFVVRRHRPGHDPVFLKLCSKNRGDTIQYEYIGPEDAATALRSQIQRYGNNDVRGVDDKVVRQRISPWAPGYKSDQSGDDNDQLNADEIKTDSQRALSLEQYNTSLPGNESRRSSFGGIIDSLTSYTSKAITRAVYSGSFKAADVVEVQRATHGDPLSRSEDGTMLQGSHTFRECKEINNRKWLKDCEMYDLDNECNTDLKTTIQDEYARKIPESIRTFSLILPSMIQRFSSIKEANYLWSEGETSFKNFAFLDIETATNGEYWMLFRGFLLLHRDAYNGRFARDRASGFGCSYSASQKLVQKYAKQNDSSREEMFQDTDPKTKSRLKGMLPSYHFQNSDADKNDQNVNAVYAKVPPPDYYLGETPGTQIWGRLRLAGLETERIFDLDTKRVILKIKCPEDRLMDVAEVLELELKTRNGDFATFKESARHIFARTGGLEGQSSSLFISSIRQHIIDYIINSQIRDTGAGLSLQHSLPRKGIKNRSPLHMHESLESLFKVWFNFTEDDHWKQIMEENDLYHRDDGFVKNQNSIADNDDELPPRINRFIVGMFYQPLDSIERYYGEKVAFYFAWLQHCSLKLIFPSILGFVVTMVQVFTQRWEDNEILPIFSFVLMVWSFHVMITWKQRQHDLTHRWGTMKYQENETPRPQFNGKYKICEVTKRSIVTYPAWKRWMKYMISIPLTMMFTTYAFLGVIMVYTNRDNVLAKYFGDPNQNVGELFNLTWNLSIIGKTDAIVAVELSTDHLSNPKFWWTVGLFPSLIGLGLPLLNFVLMRLSRMLNNFENHRTESHYRNALIAKVIAFRFVAYFAALYYYASIAAIGGFGGMAVKNGFLRIATSLVIYLTIQHWWNLLLQICVPLLILRYHKDRRNNRLRKEQRELEHSKKEYRTNKDLTVEELKRLGERITNKEALLTQGTSELWDELILPDYDPFFDYIQSVIYFAYVVCFSTVFPLTPLLVLINQLINMRLHAYKICRVRRRPLAQKTGGIANWEQVLNTVTLIGVLTNTSLMVLTNSLFNFIRENTDNQGVALLGAFVLWERIMVTIKYVMEFFITDKSIDLVKKLKVEEHKRNEKSREERVLAKNKRQSSLSLSTHKPSHKGKSPVITPKLEQFSSSSERSFLIKHQQNNGTISDTEGGAKKTSRRKKSSKKTRPKTPKVSSARRPAKTNIQTNNSPFKEFIIDDDGRSPLLEKEGICGQEVSPAISDMLSLNYDSESDEGYRTPLKPSMQRSMMTRHRKSELHAADARIRSRISARKSEKKIRK